MDNTMGITPVMPMGGGADTFGGGGFWIFALLFLFMAGGNGFGFGNNNGVNALNADMQRGFDNQNLQAQTRDILGAVTNGTAQTISASTANATNAINAIKDGNASLIREFGNVETALTALSGNMQSCCCDVKQLVQATNAETNAAIARSNYDAAMRDASTNANITAQIQSVKDMIAQNKIESLQGQVNQLQLAQAQAQSTGTNPGFTTLVQVAENNGGCACESPVSLQVVSTDAVTLADCNCVVTKIC